MKMFQSSTWNIDNMTVSTGVCFFCSFVILAYIDVFHVRFTVRISNIEFWDVNNSVVEDFVLGCDAESQGDCFFTFGRNVASSFSSILRFKKNFLPLLHTLEDDATVFLQNISNWLSSDAASYPRRVVSYNNTESYSFTKVCITWLTTRK